MANLFYAIKDNVYQQLAFQSGSTFSENVVKIKGNGIYCKTLIVQPPMGLKKIGVNAWVVSLLSYNTQYNYKTDLKTCGLCNKVVLISDWS